MSGKGSGRRPGVGYEDAWERIFGKKAETPAWGDGCKCSFAQRMVGDGCDVCNPERAAELKAEFEGEKED